MSKLEELLQGVNVEWKSLSEIGEISGAGVDKKIIESEKRIKLLNYMDIYRNKYISKDIPSMIVSASDIKIKQCNVLKGDIFFTPSSEVLNDIGKSSVALENIDGVVYSYHIMRLRLSNPNIITSMYVNYILGSDNVQNQINKKAKGLTRFGLTKTQWQQIVIPIPCPDNPEKSLEIQQEIVRILDELTSLTDQLKNELKTERQNRKKQFEFFREQLFSFEEGEIQIKPLIEIAEIGTGSRNTNEAIIEGQYPFFVRSQIPRAINEFEFDETAIITAGDGVGVGKVFHYITGKYALHQRAYRIVLKSNILSSKYLFYYIKNNFSKYIEKISVHASVTSLRKPMFEKYPIPIPSLEEQQRIVKLLDQFDVTHSAIEEEITKEIKLRTQQYEYYREKLLTFPEN